MDKHKFRKKDVHQRGGKKPALMSLLSKRSTKVEPHPVTDDGSSNSKRTTSANFSPSARSHQSTSSSNNSLSNQAAVVTSHRRTCVHNNNRFSHQFGLCCSVDAKKSATPPIAVRVRYNSMPDGIDQLALDKVAESKLILTNNKAPSAPVSPFESPEHHPTTTTRTVELQTHSIAMSACRSRLRLKLLPPALSTDIPEQHLSSPNVSSSVAIAAAAKEAKGAGVRSFSYDTINHVQHPANPSTDSLAKQSLMAAQVLNLIPTEKARERSFLAGRLAITSLLGGVELDRVLPLREIKIFVGTWNMNGQNPPKQMNDFVFPTGVDHVPDLVAIGTQESCSERFEWEVTLQETLGPTHILLHSANLGTLHLAIFIRRDLIWFCSVPEEDSLSVRPGTAFRTKGAVAISFALFGTSMLFVTSHLTAHQQKVKERVSDVKRIIHALDLPRNLSLRNKNKDVTQNFDSVYWCGDLNFRLAEPREKLLKWIETTRFPLPPHLPHGYMHTDQLSSVLSDGAAFKGFKEANIRFPPTYKYDPGTQQFDTSSKQRAPAYTDRILFKNKTAATGLRRASGLGSGMFATAVECLAYDSVPSIVTSDHKPVWALFRNAIRPGSDSIPLAAGLFNRDVYLEGMKRRLNNTNAGSSAVCAIQ